MATITIVDDAWIILQRLPAIPDSWGRNVAEEGDGRGAVEWHAAGELGARPVHR